jgi:ketosteroid isomerase-like protein
MSQAGSEVVRHTLRLAADSHRRLDERLLLRFPFIKVLLARVWWNRPPRSRLRQTVVLRLVRQGFEAANRRDYEVCFGFHDRDIELIPPPGLVGLGDEASYRGLEARIGYEQRWRAEWGDFRYEPEEFRDLGDRWLFIGRIRSSGLTSGVATDTDFANLFTLSGGRVVREQVFFNRADALQFAGLSE